jgi:hypothetical protein
MTSILDRPLDYRCLALTGSLETTAGFPDCFAHVEGDFDGQGISFGALQWNLGQGTLQPLLLQMEQTHGEALQSCFDGHYPALKDGLQLPRAGQLAWARSIQDGRYRLAAPWGELFQSLGRRPEFQEIQRIAADGIFKAAQSLCAAYGLKSERGMALMFDIRVQNGGIGEAVKASIHSDFGQLDASLNPLELEAARLRIVANRRAEAGNPRWIEDIRARKLTIADGEGTVHGRHYDLAAEFAIRLGENWV